MKKEPAIQKLVVCLLLGLFTISFVPQRFFHDALANHKDVPSCDLSEKDAACVHPENFHCGFNDLVVSSPYTSITSLYEPLNTVHFSLHRQETVVFLLSAYYLYTEGRGPPSIFRL